MKVMGIVEMKEASKGLIEKTGLARYAGEIRFWCLSLLLLALGAKVVQAIIFDIPHALGFVLRPLGTEQLLVDWGMPLVNGALFLAFAGWLPLSRMEKIGVVVAGVLMLAWLSQGGGYAFPGALLLAGLPVSYYLLLKAGWVAWDARRNGLAIPLWVTTFLWLSAGLYALGTATGTMLKVSAVIFPATYDLHLHRIDAAFGTTATTMAAWFFSGSGWLQTSIGQVYGFLGLLFGPLLACLHREDKVRALHGWRTVVVPFFVAWLCYTWLPAAGPIYLFPGDFPASVVPPSDLPSAMAYIVSAPRNAMPSMHVSGAIFVLMVSAALTRKWVFAS